MTPEELKQKALEYHASGRPGKITVLPTKSCASADDLSLAYTPGVAQPCLAIKENPEDVWKYTARGNMVAVVSDGTAVLGLGNIGAEAGLPVMEGKAVLFKHFADIDAVPICLNRVSNAEGRTDADKLITAAAALEVEFSLILKQSHSLIVFTYVELCADKVGELTRYGFVVVLAEQLLFGEENGSLKALAVNSEQLLTEIFRIVGRYSTALRINELKLVKA